ncbi:MAG TPA: hypothetical protein VGL82_17385 [Bryobacteraceae bacterium]|jgi:hypothetical protein
MGNRGGYIERIRRTLGFVATVCVAAGLLQAHHSLADVQDMKGKQELSGTAIGVKFTNPHGSLALAQRGIGRTGANALHTRDEIKVKFLPARDGSPPGFLRTVIMPHGRVIRISGNPND